MENEIYSLHPPAPQQKAVRSRECVSRIQRPRRQQLTGSGAAVATRQGLPESRWHAGVIAEAAWGLAADEPTSPPRSTDAATGLTASGLAATGLTAAETKSQPTLSLSAGVSDKVRDLARRTWESCRRGIYIGLGLFFLGLALAGVVLPGVPTTPFLLLMSFFLIRSSPRLHQRVSRLPLVGTHLREWEEHRGVRRSVKWLAYVMISGAVLLVLLQTSIPTYAKAMVLGLVAIGVYVVWRLPTIDR